MPRRLLVRVLRRRRRGVVRRPRPVRQPRRFPRREEEVPKVGLLLFLVALTSFANLPNVGGFFLGCTEVDFCE